MGRSGYSYQIRRNTLNRARLYGGYAGAYTDKEGKSFMQNQREADPNYGNDLNQRELMRDFWDSRDSQRLPTLRDLPMPGVSSSAVAASIIDPLKQTSAAGYVTDPNTGLLSKQPRMGVMGNVIGGDGFQFATSDQVLGGGAAWKDMSVEDRKKTLSDPNFYTSGQITKYDAATQNEILKDPNLDWSQLPALQKHYFNLSSSPVKMGAAQGLIMGLFNPGGALTGAGIGAVGNWAGYDQNKEAWQQGDGKFTFDAQQLKEFGSGVLGFFNFAAEVAEKTIGTGAMAYNAWQDPNKEVADVLNKDTWNANISFYEAVSPAFIAAGGAQALGKDGKLGLADAVNLLPFLLGNGVLEKILTEPEKYKGEEMYLGAALPVELQQSWVERLEDARAKVAAGGNEREIMSEMQTGLVAQAGDMIGQGIFDPLNLVAGLGTFVGKATSKVTGNKVAYAAFDGTKGITEAASNYKNLVQTDKWKTIDPNFKHTEMSWLSKQIAGVTVDQSGNITNKAGGFTNAGLLDKVGKEFESGPQKEWSAKTWKKDLGGFVRMMTSEDTRSRAETGLSLFTDNVNNILVNMFEPTYQGVRDAVGWISRVGNNDMETFAAMGDKVVSSPEFYTVLPALKALKTETLNGIVTMMDLSQPNADYLKLIEDITGDKNLIDDIAKRGTSDQDMRRIIEKAKASADPKAKALLKDIDAGKFNVDTLKEIVNIFTGDNPLPRHPEEWKAIIGNAMTDHFQNWAAERLALDKSPEAKSNFFRMVGIAKTAQSIVLLGGSPGYAITNGLSGMVHLAASGIYGFMTPKKIDTFVERMGFAPSRMDEGVGIGGMVENKGGGAMVDALKGKGPLTSVKKALGRISSGMPMSKLSSWFEKLNSRQAYAQGMKSMWSQSWRRGVGFKKMDARLIGVMKEMDINPEHIYAAIEAGMNQADIERALFGRFEGVQARSLIHDAATRTGMTPAEAADMLEKVGVLDELDTYLKGQTSKDGIEAAFNKAIRNAKDQIAIRTGEDIVHLADQTEQTVTLEGAASGLDLIQRAHGEFFDVWNNHYDVFGELFEKLQDIPDEAMKAKAYEMAYKQSDGDFRNMFGRMGATYKGIFNAWGLSGDPAALNVLQAIGESNVAMQKPYDLMRQLRHDHFTTNWNGDIDAMFNNWDKINAQIDKAFVQGQADKHLADVKMGKHLSEIYEQRYKSKAVGEAARQWWDNVVKLNEDIVRMEREFRKSTQGMNKEQRDQAKQKYYSQDKRIAIAELEKINAEGIAKLELIIKHSGGDSGAVKTAPPPAPPQLDDTIGEGSVPPTEPTAPSDAAQVQEIAKREKNNKQQRAEEAAQLARELAEQAAAREQADNTQRDAQRAAVWDVAEEYWGNGGNYDRNVFNDRNSLMVVLRGESLNGIPDLSGLDDPRLTPELVRRVLAAKAEIKAAKVEVQAAAKPKKSKGDNNVSLLPAIIAHGGLNMNMLKDLTGADKWKGMPAVFQNQGHLKGWNMDQMARMLADDGYPIDVNNPDDPGGVAQATELLRLAVTGEKIYPMGHDFEKAIKANELKHAEMMGEELNAEQQDTIAQHADPKIADFDHAAWENKVFKLGARDDFSFNEFMDAVNEFPYELKNALISPDGGTYQKFIDDSVAQAWDRNEKQIQDNAIAKHAANAEANVAAQKTYAEAAMTRKLIEEKFTETFGDDPKVQAFMQMFDAVIGSFVKITGEGTDVFIQRFYEDVLRSNEDSIDGLKQAYSRIEGGADRKMTAVDAENYARMLVRGGESDLRSAIRNEPNKADRIAILDAAHNLNAKMAESVAKGEMDILFQEQGKPSAKGAVVFDGETMKATIHAFEAADFSTLVHENAHVFRRMLSDVANKTGNERTRADLSTIEEWAGAKDGVWDVAAEEKFARGFENYLATGKAPTPALVQAFRTFKNWMLDIYKSIAGSSIDVKMTPEVRDVFARMLGNDGRTITDLHGKPMKVGDWVVYGDKQMDIINILDDGRAVLENELGDQVTTRAGQFEEIKKQEIKVDQEARAKEAAAVKEGIAGSGLLEKLKLAREQKARMENERMGVNTLAQRAEKPRQFDMFGGSEQLSVGSEQADMFAKPADSGTVGGMLPGMQTATGMMFDVQAGGGLKKMEAGNARSLYDVDPNRTAADSKGVTLGVNDIVIDENGKRHNVTGANMRGKVVTSEGKILDPKNVTRVAKQETLFQRADSAGAGGNVEEAARLWREMGVSSPYFKNWFGDWAVKSKQSGVEDYGTDGHREGGSRGNRERTGRGFDEGAGGGNLSENRVRIYKIIEDSQDRGRQEGVGQTSSSVSGVGIVNSVGQPAILQHGTRDVIEVFDLDHPNRKDKGWMGRGIYLTDADTVSHAYANNKRGPHDPIVMELYAAVKNPFYADPTLLKKKLYFESQEFIDQFTDALKEQGYDGVVGVYPNGAREIVAFSPEQVKSVDNRGTFDPNNPNILFQSTEPNPEPLNLTGDLPMGSIEAATGFEGAPIQGRVAGDGFRDQIMPLLDAMKAGAMEQLGNKPMDGASRDMSPEGQKMLRQYMKQVQNEMATNKLSAARWGEQKRDEALLNYGKRYGIDRYLEVAYPYQFFYTRSLGAWAARALDKPAWFANYARIKRQQDRYENDLPERLRGKIKINMPWLPDWMGDSMYIDPLSTLFTPVQYLKPFERMQKDATMQQQETERILQEWSADGTVTQAQLSEAMQGTGTTYERAVAEAAIRREKEISNPMDFMNTMLGPAWYLTTPLNLMGIDSPITKGGDKSKISSTPLKNVSQALDTVTEGTWAEKWGNVAGIYAKLEGAVQKKLGIPEFGEYGDYYVDRQLASMTAEGLISAEDAQLAMMERSGQNFDDARERVKMELAMRVPTMAALMSGLTADNFVQGIGRAAATLPASLFGSGLISEGELKFRGQKEEWNEAWKKADAGDKSAIPEFFADNPEYQAYLSKGKKPEERMRSFLVGQIWDGYMELGVTNQKQARSQMGDLFSQAFLNKETRSYETIPVEQLAQWAKMFGKKTPLVSDQSSVNSNQLPVNSEVPKLDLYDPSVTKVTDQFFAQRTEKFPNYYEVQTGYYNLPKSEQPAYLFAHPELKQYWSWKDSWYEAHPELVPILKGDVFKELDTSTWNPMLVDYVSEYAMSGERLPNGAWKALQQQWILAGSPMGDVKSWLNSQVVPALMYGN